MRPHRRPSVRPRRWRMLALLAVVASIVAACGGGTNGGGGAGTASGEERGDEAAATDDSGSGGTLRIAMSAGNIPIPEQFPTEGGEGRRFVGVNVYDYLLNWDADQGDRPPVPVPGLAESYEVSEDDLTYTFHLREGVTFHDGTPFDADAVVFALDRLLNPEFEFFSATQSASGSSSTAQIASYAKVDDMTVTITTKKPWSFFIYDVAAIGIPSPTAVREQGNENYAFNAVGTGPFMIDRYVDGEVMELVANPDYWGGAPKLDRIVLYPMPEAAGRLAALQSGEVDWAEVPPPDSIPQLDAEGYNVLLKSYPHIIVYMTNMYRAPFDDIRVRQAVAHGIDREGMVALINGTGIPATQYFPEGHPWHDPSFEGYSHDPERARELLAEAGYADGLSIRVAHPTGGSGNMFPGPMNEKFQQDMAEIGIDVELAPMEWNTILTMYRSGFGNPEYADFDVMYFSPNTQAPMFAFAPYLTERIPPSGCCNMMGYSDPEADALMTEAAGTFDADERDALLQEFQGTFIRDVPSVPVVHDLNLRVLTPEVRGWVQPQSWWGDFTGVWVSE